MTRTRAAQLLATPMAILLVAFAGAPLLMVVALSFWSFDGLESHPDFTLVNYIEVFSSRSTWTIFLNTVKYAVITWALTLLIGFTVAYYLVFHVRKLSVQIGLFLLCTIPFWTSTVIRMISWVPFLGKEGLFNSALLSTGVIDKPLEFLLFSDFAVILTYVNLFTLFMLAPIFVITLVMGDFFIVRVMSGGQSTSVVSAMKNNIDQLYYPQAAAMAVLLIGTVIGFVSLILRVVDVRSELAR